MSADEKTSIQARDRCHPSAPRGPASPNGWSTSTRGGALAYLAGWDVFGAHLIGQPVLKTGIDPFKTLVDKVMTQAPYRDAERVFWIVDNGSSHHPATSPARLRAWHRNAVAVHLPIHASWLNQIEIVFSIIQRKPSCEFIVCTIVVEFQAAKRASRRSVSVRHRPPTKPGAVEVGLGR